MRRCLALALLAACGSTSNPLVPTRVTAAIVATPNRSVDVLFMIDDTINLDMQDNFRRAFPAFLATLQEGGMPSLHIGVVTSDLGTSAVGDATPGPTIGTGPGMCAGTGKAGALQTNGTTVLTGNFIFDEPAMGGARITNYTGSLADAFTAIEEVGVSGCGFEQPLEAVRKALDNNPANAGFLRPEANLAIVVLTDEDDCSLEQTSLIGNDTTTFGPLQSFRCTHFGVTCDVGGLTPDMMNEPGTKDACHSNETSQYLTHVADYAAFLRGLKPDPHMVMFAAVTGDPSPVDIELRAPVGSTTPITALAHSCSYTDFAGGTEVADPAVRIHDLAGRIDRNVTASVCTADYTDAQTAIARQINSMMGSPCLTRDIALPANCVATDDTGALAAFTIVEDDAMCPDGQHLRAQLEGTPTGAVTVSCTAP